MKTYTKFKEYIWLVNTIYHAKAITFAEINERWLKTDMSEGVEMARTTFYRHKCAIEDIFGIYIECDKKNGNKYYIGNEYVLREDSVQNWMLSTLSVGNMVEESQSQHNRILLEHVPSGGEKLQQVIKAMKENRMISLTYRRYGSPENGTYKLAPYCVKLFHQRWYLLAKNQKEQMKVFAIDRILKIEIFEEKFKVDENFDAYDFFNDSYGVVVNGDKQVERIVLRAYGRKAYALLDLPIHHSQKEIKRTENYTDIEVHLRPTDDFIAHILSRGPWLQVISPQWLLENVKGWLTDTLDRYNNKEI